MPTYSDNPLPKTAASQDKSSSRHTHKSLQRAVSMLRLFSETDPALSVSQVSEKLSLHKSTVSRILSVLQEEGLLEFDGETGKYAPGVGLLTLAGVALGRIDVRAASLSALERLSALSEETVSVSVLRNDEAVTIAHFPANQSIRYVVWLGRRIKLFNTASGRLFLAHYDERARQSYLWSHNQIHLIQDKSFGKMLDQILILGFSVEIEEFEPGISAIAAPIFDYRQELKAAVSIAGPTFRLTNEKLTTLVEPLQEQAHAISEKLGFNGIYPYQSR